MPPAAHWSPERASFHSLAGLAHSCPGSLILSNPALQRVLFDIPYGYDSGYREFLVGILLREARERAGVTQEELADAIHTKKSVISRLENKASDARVSTLRKVAQALDKELVIELRDRPKQRKSRETVTA